ncbi:MAG: NAD(P)H-binding protein [Actinomycetota bacterium]|nr:NAD(P)H-binding protein [Actinomycetota bacterium]
MIALLGATGYTGRLVAAELTGRGLPHRLGARDPAMLAALAAGGDAEPFVVDARQAGRLDAFLEGADALITTVGPFARLGLAVVEAAVRNEVAYVDSAGEPAFLRTVYERFAAAPVAVVPACGFEFLLADLAAAVAAQGVEGVSEVVTAYELSGVLPSRGTVRTALEVASSSRPSPARREVRFPDGVKVGVSLPWGEEVTVPRHLPGASVTTVMVMAPLLGAVLGVGTGLLRLTRPVVAPLVDRLPSGPGEKRRRRARFRVVAEARAPSGRSSSVACEGTDVYRLTARLLVEAALRARGAGALAPAEAFDPEAFLDAVSGEGFSWRRF